MVSRGEFDFDGEEWDDIAESAKDLIRKLITRPELRLTAGEALQHPWMKSHVTETPATNRAIVRNLNIANIKNFHNQEKIKQVALMAIAVQSSPEDIHELKTIFQALDKDGNGSISFDELQNGLGDRENGEQLMEILKGADTDGNGTINYSEFLAATMDATIYLRSTYLKQAFKMFDVDGSGKIDSSELLNLLAGEEFRDVYSQAQLDQAIAEVDANGDGEIDFNEFA